MSEFRFRSISENKSTFFDKVLDTLCNREKETIKNLFCDCEYVQDYWNTVILLLVDSCGLENVTFNVCDILFGNPKSDVILNKTVLWGKKVYI